MKNAGFGLSSSGFSNQYILLRCFAVLPGSSSGWWIEVYALATSITRLVFFVIHLNAISGNAFALGFAWGSRLLRLAFLISSLILASRLMELLQTIRRDNFSGSVWAFLTPWMLTQFEGFFLSSHSCIFSGSSFSNMPCSRNSEKTFWNAFNCPVFFRDLSVRRDIAFASLMFDSSGGKKCLHSPLVGLYVAKILFCFLSNIMLSFTIWISFRSFKLVGFDGKLHWKHFLVFSWHCIQSLAGTSRAWSLRMLFSSWACVNNCFWTWKVGAPMRRDSIDPAAKILFSHVSLLNSSSFPGAALPTSVDFGNIFRFFKPNIRPTSPEAKCTGRPISAST